MSLPVPDSHLDLLTRPIHGVLTTMMPDGQPQSSLVWCDYDGECARVNTTAHNAFMDLTPAEGRRALPAALELCAEYGLYVEPVAVIDTHVRPFDWLHHAREVAVVHRDVPARRPLGEADQLQQRALARA